MRLYKNHVWDFIDNFYAAFNIFVVSREFNQSIDSLAIATSTFKVPSTPQFRYDIELRYRSYIPDNIKYWKVFEYDQHIKNFMEVIDEFSNTHID
jgi:hypothetical protein